MTFRKLLRLISLFVFISACTEGKYPEEWSSPRASFFSFLVNEGCPDIQGTWDIRKEKYIWPLFGIIDEDKARLTGFETLTITGDSRTELVLRLERSAASVLEQIRSERKEQIEKKWISDTIQKKYLERLDPKVRTSSPYNSYNDEEYEEDLKNKFGFYENLTLTLKAKRGREYICSGGWLTELYTNSTKGYGDKRFSVGLNKNGDLIRKTEHTYDSYFSFWCGDHCDNSIRLPDVHKEWWDRRVVTTAITNPSPSWKVSFKLAPKPVVEVPKKFKPLAREEAIAIVSSYLPSGVILKSVISNGGACTLEVQAGSKLDISVLLNSLSTEKKLSQPELLEIVEKQNSWIGKIYIKASQL